MGAVASVVVEVADGVAVSVYPFVIRLQPDFFTRRGIADESRRVGNARLGW